MQYKTENTTSKLYVVFQNSVSLSTTKWTIQKWSWSVNPKYTLGWLACGVI